MYDLLGADLASIILQPLAAIGLLSADSPTSGQAGFIIAMGLVAMCALVSRTWNAVRQLRSALAGVEVAQSEVDFPRLLPAISSQINSLPLLAASWERFRNSLIQPRDASPDHSVLQATAGAWSSFSPAALKVPGAFMRSLPGLFLSLTLLMTLAGIVLSLGGPHNLLASDGKGALTAERLQQAAVLLLSTGGSAFAIAVSGLIVSLLLTATLLICKAWLGAAASRLCAALDQRIVQISFEATVLERLAAGDGQAQPAQSSRAAAASAKAAESDTNWATQLAAVGKLDEAVGSLNAAIDRSTTAATASGTAAFRQLAEDFKGLLDDRVYGPVEAMTDEMIRLRGQIVSFTAQNGTAGERNGEPTDPSGHLQALQSGRTAPSGLSEAQLREALAGVSAQLEDRVGGQVGAVAAKLSSLHDKFGALEAAWLDERQTAVLMPPSTVPNAELRSEIARLRSAMELNSTATAAAQRAAIEQLMERFFAQVDLGIASSLRGVLHAVDEVRSKLAAQAESPAPAVAAGGITSMFQRPPEVDRTHAEIATLRRSFEDAVNRMADANRAAIAEVVSGLGGRIDGLASPQQHVLDAMTEVRGRLNGLEVPLAQIASQVAAQREAHAASLSSAHAASGTRANEQAAQMEGLRVSLLEAIGQAHDRITDYNLQVANALAEDVAQRIETNVATPMQGLAETLARVSHTLEGAVVESDAATGSTAAFDLAAVAAEIRQATADMKGQLANLATQGQSEHASLSRDLIAQIETSVSALGNVTSELSQHGVAISTQVRQLADAVPSHLERDAEAAARILTDASANAQARLEAAVASLTEATVRDTGLATEALTRISEQLVRQSVHARDVLAEQLSTTTRDVERAMSSVTLAFDRLNGTLAQGAQAVTKDALSQLTVATAELTAVARLSNEENTQTAAGIWQAAVQVRAMIASDLDRIREQILKQAEQVNADAAGRLRETAAEVAQMMAGYGGDLSAATGTLVETLQTLSHEMRRLEPKLAPAEPVVPTGVQRLRQPLSAMASVAAAGSDETPEAMLSRLIENRRIRS